MSHWLDRQLVEERIDTDTALTSDPTSSDIDEIRQYLWGERYVDDIVAQRSQAVTGVR